MLCEFCNKETTNPRYCSRSCAAKINNSRRKNRSICSCGKECNDRHTSFCSQECYFKSIYPAKVAQWKRTGKVDYQAESIPAFIKRYLRERSGDKCEADGCGWNKLHPVTGLVPLQVDHIDGDSTNNREDNLRLLCPNCHSLTPTYGNLNRGKGRKRRKEKRTAVLV